MPETKEPIFERCTQHPVQCKSIADCESNITWLKKELVRAFTSIGERIKTRTLLGFLGLMVTLIMAMIAFSIQLNVSAIDDVETLIHENGEQAQYISRSQHQIQIDISKIQGKVTSIAGDVEDLKRGR